MEKRENTEIHSKDEQGRKGLSSRECDSPQPLALACVDNPVRSTNLTHLSQSPREAGQ